MAVTSAQVQELYVGLLGRAADKAGLDYWVGQLNATGSTLTLENLRANFVNEQPEYAATYGNLARADLVKAIYTNLFERTPTAEEVNYWANGSVSADQMVVAFLNGASTADQLVVSNKVFVAQTYSNAVGATNFDKAAAASVIANVDSTPASVTAAINTISSGSLPGLTPGANLLDAVAKASAAIDAYAKSVAVSNSALDGNKDGSVTSAEATAALNAANTARALPANGGTDSTATLQAAVTNATNEANVSKAVVSALTGGAAAVAAYDAALAAQKATLGTTAEQTAAAVAKASAQAAFGTAFAAQTTVTVATLDAKTGAAGDITDAATLYNALVTSTNAVERAALVAEVNKVGATGVALVAAADKDVAVNKAAAQVASTKATLEAIDIDSATPAVQATDYAAKAAAVATATDTLAKAQAADVAIAAAKAVVDQYTVLNKAATDAAAAITAFNSNAANINKVAITALDVAGNEGTVAKDVFYFPAKIAGNTDVTLGATTAFGTGDAIVVGSGYTFNAGALSTGNNNALEVFFVKGVNGTQVVIESNAVGSATAVVGADGTLTTHNDVAVINLVGVTADHLSFNNGVISYV